METPTSSSRRITRSKAFATRKIEESEKRALKPRSALIDITNDSPIVGLAVGNIMTPLSTVYKTRMIVREDEEDDSKHDTTPGSGEALLRDQVQTLLQKVEEEALIKKIIFEPKNFGDSPMYVFAPTPANTPQFSESNNNGSESLTVSPVGAESFNLLQKPDQQEETEEALGKMITRLLFTDIPEKLEGYDSSLDDEDSSSVWSVQVNASTRDEDEVDEEIEVGNEDGVVDDDAKFNGKDEGFVYDNDGELEVDA